MFQILLKKVIANYYQGHHNDIKFYYAFLEVLGGQVTIFPEISVLVNELTK